MFTLRQILDKFREYNLQTHHLFIDFKAAYDSGKRNELWQIMVEHGFPAKLIRLVRATLDGSKSSERVADETSTSFVTLDGLKQGDALSSLLFNIALEGAIRRAGVQRSGTIVTRSHMLLGFADDIDIGVYFISRVDQNDSTGVTVDRKIRSIPGTKILNLPSPTLILAG